MDIFLDSLQFYAPIFNNLILLLGVEYFNNGYFLGFFMQCVAKKIDEILPLDDKNMNKEEQNRKKNHFLYTIPLFLAIISDTFQMFYVINKVTNSSSQLSGLNCFLLISSAGLTLGNTINISHELIHRLTTLEQAAGFLNFVRVMYCHYPIFHLLSHHKYVGTEKDPIVAKKDETLYQYLPRQLWGNYVVSWKCENERLIQQEKTSLPQFHYKNRMIYNTLLQLAFPLLILTIYRRKGLYYYLWMVFVAVLEAEIVEYLEHYGLFVTKDNKVSYDCAWNCPQRYTNMSSFKLERHADHHVNAYKEYQISSFEYSWPQLPESYLFMMQVSMKPQLWFSIMNPRLESFFAQKEVPKEHQEFEKKKLDNFYKQQLLTHSIILLISFLF
ncbi:hypothetical protein ABPG72_017875 [Tetrahymena utriculariae]